jgi:bifunctional DNA-binding transcriptional regulator/antitoxin component of YhaV-PrlF toxin-antitoxin module
MAGYPWKIWYQRDNKKKRGSTMVKINITIEGEDVSEIINELLHMSIELLKTNRKEIREVLKILADESLEILNEKKTLEKGAELYRKINSEINWTYKRDKE